MTPGLHCRANLRLEVRDAQDGRLLARHATHNLVVTAGRNLIRDLLKGASADSITHLALGTGTDPVTAADTTLATEVFRAALTDRVAADARLTCTYYLAAGSANGHTLTEAGLLTAASGGTLYARALLAAPLVKTAAIAVTVSWELTWTV